MPAVGWLWPSDDDGDDGDVHNHDDGVVGVIIGVSDWLRGYTASPAGGVSSQTLQMEKSLLRSAGDDVEVFWRDERQVIVSSRQSC